MQKQKENFDKEHSKYLFGFSCFSEISPNRFKKIVKYFNSIKTAWDEIGQKKFREMFGEMLSNKLLNKKNSLDLEKEFQTLKKEGIEMVSPEFNFKDFPGINSKYFPKNLREIPHSPFVLFAKGNLELLTKKQISIVGSRKPTHYGKQALEKIGPDIAQSELIITSGMAIGTDSLAHRIALNNKKPTIAVLGSGLAERILQKSFSYKLSQEIISKNGLLVSEYPPNFEANKFTFPARNRIISGLSIGVLVVEAAQKSGTLITTRHALEQNREIFAIPGSIFSFQSIGTNNLIKQGAQLVSSAKDIFETLNLGFNPSEEKSTKVFLENKEEEAIYKVLSFEPQPIDKIAIKSKLDISTVSVKLSIMELGGKVKNIQRGYVRS